MSFGETKARIRSEHNMLSGYLDLSGMDAYARDVQDYIHDIRLFDRLTAGQTSCGTGPELF